jgi:hypothetical protein
LSRLRLRKLSCAAVTRIVLAGLLSLVLLSGVVPSGALTSSAEQTCTMSCCVGKPPHQAGSCGAAFSATETVEAASHCGTARAHLGGDEKSARRAPEGGATLTAHVLTTPCSPECAAASAFAHVRRAPDTAALAESKRPLSHCFTSLAEHTARLQKPSAAQGRQARPRAPPPATT